MGEHGGGVEAVGLSFVSGMVGTCKHSGWDDCLLKIGVVVGGSSQNAMAWMAWDELGVRVRRRNVQEGRFEPLHQQLGISSCMSNAWITSSKPQLEMMWLVRDRDLVLCRGG